MRSGFSLDSKSILAYFGTPPTPISFSDWLASVDRAIITDRHQYLSGHHNLHSLYLLRRNTDVARFYKRCNDCYLDGMPLRLILAGTGSKMKRTHRFSLMDKFSNLLEHAQRHQWRVFYLGSSGAVVDTAQSLVKQRYPSLDIQMHHGYLEQDEPVIRQINHFRPHLLLVGMGMPRQESWLVKNIDALDACVATQAGATLDYFAGTQAKPPHWASKLGLAWLYRLWHDPARLWRRYLLEPWALVIPTLKLWCNR